MTSNREEAEQRIRQSCEARQFEPATSLILRTYGNEITSFLAFRLRSCEDAAEVFSMFAEDLWTSLPDFGFRCSARTWAYTLARNAAARYRSSPERRAAYNIPISQTALVSELVAQARSKTDVFQQSVAKDRMRALREQLDEEGQLLLVLRVDRNLPWRDLTLAMSGDVLLDDAAIERETARLRKAFQRVKAQLRELLEREGLLEPKD